MSVAYVDLVDYVAIAAEVTGLEVDTLMRVAKLDLADSALHAPAAGFGDVEFYPDFVDKAAVLVVHLAKNHPLPDGNKRAAWVTLRVFIETNGWTWSTPPTVDDAEHAVLAIASGEVGRGDNGRLAARTTQHRELTPKGSIRRSRSPSPISGAATGTATSRCVWPSTAHPYCSVTPFLLAKWSVRAGSPRTPPQTSSATRGYLGTRTSRRTPTEYGRNWAQVAVTPNCFQTASQPCSCGRTSRSTPFKTAH